MEKTVRKSFTIILVSFEIFKRPQNVHRSIYSGSGEFTWTFEPPHYVTRSEITFSCVAQQRKYLAMRLSWRILTTSPTTVSIMKGKRLTRPRKVATCFTCAWTALKPLRSVRTVYSTTAMALCTITAITTGRRNVETGPFIVSIECKKCRWLTKVENS